MSYRTDSLISLNQLKSALTSIKGKLESLKVNRTIATISKSNWTASTAQGNFKYTGVIGCSNYNYYDVHLTTDTDDAISIMCANSDIKAIVENSELNLYANTKPTESFRLEIIVTPIQQDTIGLTYDIGDDSLVYPSITDGLRSDLDALSTAVSNKILFSQADFTVATSTWSSSGVSAYPYKAEINMSGVTANYFPIVQFRDSDTLIYDFSPNAVSSTNKVTIYCKTAPTTSIVIPRIICYLGTQVTVS